METVEICVIHEIQDHVILIAAEARLCIGATAVYQGIAGRPCCTLVGRGVAYPVAIGEAVVIFAALLKSVIKTQVMPHFVAKHPGVARRRTHPAGFHDDPVFWLAMGTWEIRIPGHTTSDTAAAYFFYQPNVYIFFWIPTVYVFECNVLGAIIEFCQSIHIACNARTCLVVGGAFGQAKLNHGVVAAALIVVSGVGK